MYMYSGFTLLYARNQYNIENQLYSNKIKVILEIKHILIKYVGIKEQNILQVTVVAQQ